MSARSAGESLIVSSAVFLILEAASLFILGTGASAQQSWLGRGFNNVKAVVWGGVGNISSYFSLHRENEKLAGENFELVRRMEALRYGFSTEQAEWTAERCRYSYLPANVMTMTTESQHNYLIIDRGRDDGVEADDGIITAQGVIGVVQGVTDRFSYALSYANADMVISARIGREGSVGSLKWSGAGTRESFLEGIPLHCTAELGDTVFTSGFSSMFPPDIPLGTVVGKGSKGGSSARMKIMLLEDFSSLRHVLVVKNMDRKQIESLTDEE